MILSTASATLLPLLPLLGEFLLRVFLAGIVVLRKRRAPVARLAWIVLILAVPIVGFVLYLIVGEIRPGRKRLHKHRHIIQRIRSAQTHAAIIPEALHPHLPREYQQIANLAEHVGDNDPLAGNALTLIGDTDEFINHLIEDIEAAQHHCHILVYIYLTDHSGRRVAEALMRAVERGVACRVLVDAVGSKNFLDSDLCGRMRKAGVSVVAARPTNFLLILLARIDLRNHRKIVVIDGRISYTGSQNIADAEFAIKKKYAPWVDAMVRIEGPVTWDLQVLFVEDWYLDTDESLEQLLSIRPPYHPDGVPAQVMGTGPNANNEAMRQLCQVAFHTAVQELIVTTPYFVPDEATLTALCTAARRGVETFLVVPARNDSPLVAAASRSFYEPLLECGVRILEYHKGLLHAKTITIDRQLALVSTANLDRRSFELNFEVNLLVYDSDFASQLRYLQRSYMAHATRVEWSAWQNRSWPAKLWQNAAGTLSPVL